jgi:uncharacterized protein (TIGR04255 family)
MLPDRRYAKPPLIEVLADFYFESDEDQGWDSKHLFTFIEQIKLFGYPVEESPAGRGRSRPRGTPFRRLRRASFPWRYRFASEDGNRTAQVGEHLLVINQFPPYYGWRNFKEQALQCYDLYQHIWPNARIAHAGLHYVDVVKVPGDDFYIDDYFNMYPVVPEVLVKSLLQGVAMSCEVSGADAGDLCSIGYHQRPSADPDVSTFRFRWDYVRVDEMPADHQAVEQWLDRAHDFLRVAFRSTFTERSEQLFDPQV